MLTRQSRRLAMAVLMFAFCTPLAVRSAPAVLGGDTYVINATDGTVLVVKGTWNNSGDQVNGGSVTATITGFDEPTDLAVGEAFVWVVNSGARTVAKVSRATHQIVGTMTVGKNPRSLALLNTRAIPGSRREGPPILAVLYGKKHVALFDADTDEKLAVVKVGKNPLRIRGDRFSQLALTANADSYSIIDVAAATARVPGRAKFVTTSKAGLCEGATQWKVSDLDEIPSTTYNVFGLSCDTRTGRNSTDPGNEGLLTFIEVMRFNPSKHNVRTLMVPTGGAILGLRLHPETSSSGSGPMLSNSATSQPVTMSVLNPTLSGRAEADIRYAIFDSFSYIEIGPGRALTHFAFAHAEGDDGDAIVLGPVNCPGSSSALLNPDCSSSAFRDALSGAIAGVPADADLIMARPEPRLLPDPPFGQ